MSIPYSLARSKAQSRVIRHVRQPISSFFNPERSASLLVSELFRVHSTTNAILRFENHKVEVRVLHQGLACEETRHASTNNDHIKIEWDKNRAVSDGARAEAKMTAKRRRMRMALLKRILSHIFFFFL
jgi:hypothetical protein